MNYLNSAIKILEAGRVVKEHISASRWYEANMVMPPSKPFPGPFSYDLSPYWREPVDLVMPDSPVQEVTIMTVNQIGKTDAVINPWIGYTISEHPGPIQYLTGHEKGNAEAVRRIDEMLDECGLRARGLIKPQTKRARNTKSGDTDDRKDFLNGHMIMGVLTNVKSDARQHTIRTQIRDDMDAAPILTKSGETLSVFNTRTDAFGSRKKILNISTPEIAGLSNIERCWNRSDKRYYNVPCPCCSKIITLEWEIDKGKDKAGLFWRVDSAGQVIESSIEYICQKCGNGFREKEKYEMNLAGVWVPTVENPKEKQHRGYTINALYPVGMRTWYKLIEHYLKAYPGNGVKDEGVEQTLYNLVFAKPYEKSSDEMKATDLQIHNRRPYLPGIVPEDMSIRDGNGRLWFLTMVIDLNGVYLKEGREDDVRLDWEVMAWSEGGPSYSVKHGSIGTFVYRETEEQKAVHRDKWTYDHSKPNNVWKEVDKLRAREFKIAGSPKSAKIMISLIDTGNWESAAFEYVDTRQGSGLLFGIKGTGENKMKRLDTENRNFKDSPARPGSLYIVDGHSIKDKLANMMRLKWRIGTGEQPSEFMNFPTDSRELVDEFDRKYMAWNYFDHYEAEHKVPSKNARGEDIGHVWKKKNSAVQNHCLDLRVYGMVAVEIWLHLYLKELKRNNPAAWKDINYLSWTDFIRTLKNN